MIFKKKTYNLYGNVKMECLANVIRYAISQGHTWQSLLNTIMDPLNMDQAVALQDKLDDYIVSIATADPNARTMFYYNAVNGADDLMYGFETSGRDTQIDIIKSVVEDGRDLANVGSFWDVLDPTGIYSQAFYLLLLSVLTPYQISKLRQYINLRFGINC